MLDTLKRSCRVLLLSIIAGACSSGSGYNSPPLRVMARTVEDTVTLKQSPTATYFDVTGVVRNDDSREIKVASCGPDAERDIDGTWTMVFTPVCPIDVLTPLAQGDSASLPAILRILRVLLFHKHNIRLRSWSSSSRPVILPR